MPFRDLNPIKFRYLLSYGTREGELRRFFSENFKLLILNRARLRNPPPGRKERIDTIVDKLPSSTDGVVQSWFQTNITVEMPEPVEEILEWFQVFNDGEGGLPDDEAKKLARSALVHLFAEAPDEALLSYFRRGPSAKGQQIGAGESTQHVEVESPDTELSDADSVGLSKLVERFPRLIGALVSGQDALVDDLMTELPLETKIFIDGVLGARNGAHEALEQSIAALPVGSAEYEALTALRGRARVTAQSEKPSRAGLQVVVPEQFNGAAQSHWKIIGVAVKDLDPAIFVRPLAVEIEGSWRRLAADERPRLFPESGDVMGHRTHGRRVPHVGEYVCWDVDEKPTAAGRARMHFSADAAKVFEVIEISASSSDPDGVKMFIMEALSSASRRTYQSLLFALNDGLIVAPQAGDPSKDECFDQPWNAWPSARAFLVDGRLLHLGLPTGSPTTVDFAPVDTALKRLIRSLSESNKTSLTKRQINEMCELIRSGEVGFVDARLKRVAERIELVRLDQESLSEVIPMIERRPDVQALVSSYVDAEVSRRIADKKSILDEIESARRRREEIETAIKEEEKRLRSVKKDAQTAVRVAFEEAMGSGLKTLATAEIFDTLARRKEASAISVPAPSHLIPVASIAGTDDVDQVVSELRALGIRAKMGFALCLLSRALPDIGACLVVRGRFARQAVRTLVRYKVESAAAVDVPLGLTDSGVFSASLNGLQAEQALAVLNADCAPIDLYATTLIDSFFDRVTALASVRRVLFSTVGGEIGVQISPALRAVSIIVDLDRELTESRQSIDELDDGDTSLLPHIIEKLVSWCRCLSEDDREAIEWLIPNGLTL